MKFLKPVNGVADIQENELYEIEEEKNYCILCCFAGRFPRMRAIIELTKKWGVECRFDNLPNGFVLFWFKNEEDKQKIVDGEPYYVYGKLMSIRILPENFQLENCDLCMVPVWVRLPGLPIQCWHPLALSRIASCIGRPISMDAMTRDMRKEDYARVLIEVDSSDKLPLVV